MRHPLNWLTRVGRSAEDRLALLGDLAEEYRVRVRHERSWFRAQVWYIRELLAALGSGIKDGVHMAPISARRVLTLGDVRLAFRRWRRRPGFVAAVIATLGLGIGATTAIFSVVDAVLLRPLPWTDPDRLVVLHAVYPGRAQNPATAATWNRGLLTYPMWDALRTVETFDRVAVWRAVPRSDSTIGEARTDIVQTMDVSANLLPTLGVALTHGRLFNDREDNVPSEHIILTHESWQARFSGRADIIGLTVTMGSASSGGRYPKTVIGVIEPGFQFGGIVPEVLLPVGIYAETARTYLGQFFRSVARLAPGVPIDRAAAAAATTVGGVERREDASARLVPVADEMLGAASRPLWLLLAAASLLLVIACSNVAGLLLGEARNRRHEIAVRTALGGSRGRVLRQLFVEHAILAGAGAVVGLALATWFTQSLLTLAPEGLPRIDSVTIDARAAGFSLALGFLTLVLFGLVPAFSLARTPAAAVLAEGGRDGASSRHAGQRLMVSGQIALTLVLLVGATLFGETLFRMLTRPLGFEPRNLAILSTTYTGERYSAAVRAAVGKPNFRAVVTEALRENGVALNTSALERLRALPGVLEAAGASSVPFAVPPSSIQVTVQREAPAQEHRVHRQVITDRYLDVMRVPMVSGRNFTDSDEGGANVAIVSREFERRVFGKNALNQSVVYHVPNVAPIVYRIIGVAGNVKLREYSDDDQALLYAWDRQSGAVSHFVVKTAGDPEIMLPAIRKALRDDLPQLVVTVTTTGDITVGRSIADERFRASLSIAFGAAALMLAAVGLYGLSARRAAARRREFGVRVALGAQRSDVTRLVVRDAIVIVALGLVLGLPVAYIAAQATPTLLFGVSTTEPRTFLAAAAVLALTATAATILPARRASRQDPILALKE